MALIKIGDVWQNLLTLLILFFTFFMIYKSMKEGKLKQGIRDFVDKMKVGKKDGK